MQHHKGDDAMGLPPITADQVIASAEVATAQARRRLAIPGEMYQA